MAGKPQKEAPQEQPEEAAAAEAEQDMAEVQPDEQEQPEEAAAAQPVDLPHAARPLKPGKPVEHQALSQMGHTFAERAAAREGKRHKRTEAKVQPNSTFAERAKANKAVTRDDAENKAVEAESAESK